MTPPAHTVTAILPCNDLDASESFYRRLGFTYRSGPDDYRMLSDGKGGELHLMAAAEGWLIPGRNPFSLFLYATSTRRMSTHWLNKWRAGGTAAPRLRPVYLKASERRVMAKAVIFDVDGTLVNSVDLHARAWQDAFHDYGHDLEFEDIRGQIGKGGDQLMPVFLDPGELEATGQALERHRGEILRARGTCTRSRPFQTVRALFKRLQSDGKQIALASSAKKEELAKYKQLAQIEDLIHAETSSDDAEKSKPHPDIFQAAMKRLGGVSAEEILVVGDTPYDAEAAGKAGVRTIGVLCGGFSEESLRKAGCIAIYKDPADLLARYDQSPLVHDAPANGPELCDDDTRIRRS